MVASLALQRAIVFGLRAISIRGSARRRQCRPMVLWLGCPGTMSAEMRCFWVPDLGSRRSLALLATRAMGRRVPEAVAWERAKLHESSEARRDNCDVVFLRSERCASRQESVIWHNLFITKDDKARKSASTSPRALESQRLGDERERQDLITPTWNRGGWCVFFTTAA